MHEKKIIITGASGFIGSHLVTHFAQRGWKVTALVRAFPETSAANVIYVKYNLQEQLAEGAFAGADYLVHCAFIKNDIEMNVEGTKKLLGMSRKNNLKKNIFISSFSAGKDALSMYGKQKYEVEELFNSKQDCIVRAGVVIGNGGLFKQVSDHIRKGKMIPLVDGGKQPLQTIYIDDLVRVIEKIFSEDFSGIFSVAETAPVLYKDFFRAVCEKHQVKPRFIPVPFYVLNLAVSAGEFLGIPLPISKENILGLKNMRAVDTANDLQKLGIIVSSYKESLGKL